MRVIRMYDFRLNLTQILQDLREETLVTWQDQPIAVLTPVRLRPDIDLTVRYKPTSRSM
jgi:antitoxin (DNA-binding transcriptional repressor) of toxin-antitoxin stability system